MLSSSGFRDALGDRDLRFDRESGLVYERLFLRPELAAYESALKRRVDRLSSMEDLRLVPIESVEQDHASRRVVVVSRQVSGLRLQQILRTARDHGVVPDLSVALFLTTELLTAARSFQALSGLAHGAITPDRVIVSPEGDVLLADYAYAEVIDAAHFNKARLWREFGIAAWLGEPFSFPGDVRQCALIAIALMLGRPIGTEASTRIDALLAEVEEAAMIRGGRLLADPVIGWLTRAIRAGGDGAFQTADDAADGCAALLTDRERSMARPALIEFFAELDEPLVVPSGPQEPLAQPPLAIETTSVPLEIEGLPASPASSVELPEYEGPGPEFMPVSVPDPQPLSAPLPAPDPTLMAQPEPAARPDPIVASEPEPVAAPVSVATPVPVAPPAAPSTTAWPPPPAPSLEVGPDAGPRVVSQSPFALSAAARANAIPAAPPPMASPEPPMAREGAPPARPVPLPALPVFPARVVEAVAPSPAPASDASLRLKSESPIRLKEPARPKRRSSTSLRLDDRPDVEPADESEESGLGWNIPWKYVAAAVVVLVVGLAAAKTDWGSSTPVEASPPAKLEAPPSPPPTTGSIEVISNTPGSKVLIDGKVRGETPLTVGDLQPGRHVVVVRASNGNARRTIRVVAGQTAKLDLAVYSGWIVVSAPIELQVLENGKSIGTAGEGPIVLAAGHHTIEVANKALNYRSAHAVDIQPGEEKRLELNPNGLVSLNAVPWAEVWLDGTKLGDTPLGNVKVPLGSREFVFKHPQFGERKVSTTVTWAVSAQISVDFTK